MQKNKLILPIILLLLALGAYYFISKNKDQSSAGMSFPDREFAYKNFDDIQRIELDRPKYPKQYFERKGNVWILNNKDEVNNAVINNMLSVLKGVKIKYIPTKAGTAKILEEIDEKGIKIRLYDAKGNKVRSYKVGTETADGLGVSFLMDGANQPYIMYLPGLEGSVRNRLTFDYHEWKNKDVFNEDAKTIQSFEIRYPQNKASSFIIQKNGGAYSVTNPDVKDGIQKQTNQKTVEAYLHQLIKIEGEANDENNPNRQEIMSFDPFAIVTIKYTNGNEKKLTFISLGDIMGTVKTTSPNQVHPDNSFFISTSDGKYILCQYRVLKNVIKPNLYFY